MSVLYCCVYGAAERQVCRTKHHRQCLHSHLNRPHLTELACMWQVSPIGGMSVQEVLMTLRILSYNILWGGEDRLPLIARVIQLQQPDVVALLEANSRPKAEALSQQLGMNLIFGNANSAFH